MTNAFESHPRSFLLLQDETEEVKIARQILESPLRLTRELICHLFDSNLVGLARASDTIKGFAAGIESAKREAQRSYSLASYYLLLFPFQQWFHSSYRARQGKVLEALTAEFIRNKTAFNEVLGKQSDKKAFLERLFNVTDLSIGDIDILANSSKLSKCIVMQLRSRDDTGGTTAKGSLVEALKALLRTSTMPHQPLLYLVGVWDAGASVQRTSAANKIQSEIRELVSPQVLEDFETRIFEGISVGAGLVLRLAYGLDQILEAVLDWQDANNGQSTRHSPESWHTLTKAVQKTIDLVTSWDDLWISYAVASIEIDITKTKGISNIQTLRNKCRALGIHLDHTCYRDLQRSIDAAAQQLVLSWTEPSVPLTSPADQSLYIRDLLYLLAIYERWCGASSGSKSISASNASSEMEQVCEPSAFYQARLFDMLPQPTEQEVTPVSFRDLVPEITDTTYLTHGLYYYPAKFIPHVPHYCIRHYTAPDDWVLDPFAGSATVGLEAALLRRNAILLDINPMLNHIVPTKILFRRADLNPSDLMHRLAEVRDSRQYFRPSWSNIEYWYDSRVLEVLCRYWGWLKEHSTDPYAQVIEVAMLRVSKHFSYAEHKAPKLFKSRYKRVQMDSLLDSDWRSLMDNMLVEESLEALYRLKDLARLQLCAQVIYRGGVDTATSFPQVDEPVCAVITSPPYLQAQEYIRTSKLELYWLGYSEEQVKQVSRLEIPYRKAPEQVYTPTLEKVRSRLLRPNLLSIVDAYFYYTLRALQNASETLCPDGRMCIFVGNPVVDGIQIETWRVVAEYFEPMGFEREHVYEDEIKNRQLFRGRRNKNPEGMKAEYLLVLRKRL